MYQFSFVVTRGTDMSFLVAGLLVNNPNLSFDYKDTCENRNVSKSDEEKVCGCGKS